MHNGPNLTTKGRVFFFGNPFPPLLHPIPLPVPTLPAFSVFIYLFAHNSLSLPRPRSQHCFHWRDQWDCLLWNRWTLCEARVYRCAELAYIQLSLSKHCALPLDWVGGGTKISGTWTLCSKVYSLSDETKAHRLVPGQRNDCKMCISGSTTEYKE